MRKYISGGIAVILIMVASAFTIVNIKHDHKAPATTVWYYNGAGTALSDFQNGSNWNTTNVGVCVEDGPKPCQVSADASTQPALSTYLSSFSTKQAILNLATARKE